MERHVAVVPLLVAVVLFGRDASRRSLAWWVAFGGMVVALPNAPYVLTDVVHLPGSLRAARPSFAVESGVGLAYALLFTVGVASYVLGVAAVTTLFVVAVAATMTRWLALGAAEQFRRHYG